MFEQVRHRCRTRTVPCVTSRPPTERRSRDVRLLHTDETLVSDETFDTDEAFDTDEVFATTSRLDDDDPTDDGRRPRES